jgi:hypothetical protein
VVPFDNPDKPYSFDNISLQGHVGGRQQFGQLQTYLYDVFCPSAIVPTTSGSGLTFALDVPPRWDATLSMTGTQATISVLQKHLISVHR